MPDRANTRPLAVAILMEVGAIDFCNFDASWSGGPTVWRRMAAVAGTYGVAVGHHEEPQVSSTSWQVRRMALSWNAFTPIVIPSGGTSSRIGRRW